MDDAQVTQEFDAIAGTDDTPPAQNGRSILDGLRELRERKASESVNTLTLDVPRYEGRLAVVYRYPEDGYKRVNGAIERSVESTDPDSRLNGASDVLIACCGSVIARDPHGNPFDLRTEARLEPDVIPDAPYRFNKELAELFEIEVPDEVKKPARLIVRELFSPRAAVTGEHEGDLALIAHGNRLFTWLNGYAEALDEAWAGE